MSFEHIQVRPLSGSLGAEVQGVDLTVASDAVWDEIRQAFRERMVLVFPDQRLDPQGLAKVGRQFGELFGVSATSFDLRNRKVRLLPLLHVVLALHQHGVSDKIDVVLEHVVLVGDVVARLLFLPRTTGSPLLLLVPELLLRQRLLLFFISLI